ncbi:MAG TPA: hypothetical protein VK588_14070 [Chitinophagaceae bacterium]|nr:hypothetical protein [Chitinophagaceae bacterium]
MEEESTRTKKAEEETISLPEHITDFLETYSQLIIVNVAQKSVSIASSVISSVTIALLFFLVVLFIGIGAAWWVGNLTNSRAAGFFIVGGFYLLCMFVLLAFRKKTILPFLRDFITRKLYE